MRPSEHTNRNNEVKAPLNSKTSSLMRLPIKKIYCPKCQKLIKGQKQIINGVTQVVCPRCSQSLWSWKSTAWRSTERAVVSP